MATSGILTEEELGLLLGLEQQRLQELFGWGFERRLKIGESAVVATVPAVAAVVVAALEGHLKGTGGAIAGLVGLVLALAVVTYGAVTFMRLRLASQEYVTLLDFVAPAE